MIRNLVFDVGGVLLEYRWREMFLQQGLQENEIDKLDQALFRDEIWAWKLDTGAITVAQAIVEFREKGIPHPAEVTWFLQHIEEMAVPRPEIWKQVENLKEKGYRIYLLSNYSKEMFEKHTKGASFLKVLDGGVISYQIHAIKPDHEIYETLLQRYDLKPEECLFFDDRMENVEGGKRAGMEAVQVTSREMLSQTLDLILKADMDGEIGLYRGSKCAKI